MKKGSLAGLHFGSKVIHGGLEDGIFLSTLCSGNI